MLNKIMLLIIIMLLNSCSIFYNSDDRLSIDIYTQNQTNQGMPITILITQPVNSEKFIKASYADLSQQALKDEMKLYVIQPNQLKTNLKVKVGETPLAVYFIMEQTPNSRWKYLIEDPQGKHLSFNFSQNRIEKIGN